MTPPLRSGSGRCWISAFVGTAKNPANTPSSARFVATLATFRPLRDASAANTVIPIDPSGISPYSIFPPERYPAATLPSPIPTATAPHRKLL